eukprot:13235_3
MRYLVLPRWLLSLHERGPSSRRWNKSVFVTALETHYHLIEHKHQRDSPVGKWLRFDPDQSPSHSEAQLECLLAVILRPWCTLSRMRTCQHHHQAGNRRFLQGSMAHLSSAMNTSVDSMGVWTSDRSTVSSHSLCQISHESPAPA